jgi:AcrR family transcriptional regulator
MSAMPEASPTQVHAHRSRLLEGMARAVSERGYGDTTIADIVREASVSRRTFYEHFSSKAQCLIALYEAASHNALKVLRDSLEPHQDGQARVESALTAYLGCMAQNPKLVRTLFIEILGLGSEGLAARRRVNQAIADFILGAANAHAAEQHRTPLSSDMAMAIIGGVNELILQYIEQDRAPQLVELVGPSSQLLRAVIRAGA